MGLVASEPAPSGIDEDQTSREATLRELGESMAAIEAAAKRIDRSIKTLKLRNDDPSIIAALERCLLDLLASRRRLHHDGYLSAPQAPMFTMASETSTETLTLFADEQSES